MSSSQRIRRGLGTASLIVFIITFSIAATIWFTPLYSWTAQHFNIADQLGLSHEQLMENYQILLEYLNKPWVNKLNMPDFSSSESGLFHFYEVKILFWINYIAMAVSAALSFFFLRNLRRTDGFSILIRPFRWAMIIPVVLLGLLAVNFDRMFVIFHELLFNNDDWIFNPSTDPIILALPQEFFMYCFMFAFFIMMLLFFIIYRLGKRSLRQNK